MRAGSLRSVLTILARGSAQDAWGQPLPESWLTHATGVRGNVQHLSGAATIKADSQVSVVRVSIRIHYRSDIAAAMRVCEGADTYEIDAVLPDKVRRQFVDLVCTRVS